MRGFFTASLLFCVGPIAIIGSIQDGVSGEYQLLVVKSILDGFAALAFASSMGIGVLFFCRAHLALSGRDFSVGSSNPTSGKRSNDG